MAQLIQNVPAAIASGQTTSGIVDMKNLTPVGIFLPATMTGVAVTFLALSPVDGVTYVPVKDGAGASYSVTVAGGQYVPLDQNKFLGLSKIKLVSGSAEAADRSLYVAGRF